MTVKDLIEKLQKLPQDALIGIYDQYFEEVYPIEIQETEYLVTQILAFCLTDEDLKDKQASYTETIYGKGYELYPNSEQESLFKYVRDEDED